MKTVRLCLPIFLLHSMNVLKVEAKMSSKAATNAAVLADDPGEPPDEPVHVLLSQSAREEARYDR